MATAQRATKSVQPACRLDPEAPLARARREPKTERSPEPGAQLPRPLGERQELPVEERQGLPAEDRSDQLMEELPEPRAGALMEAPYPSTTSALAMPFWPLG